MPAAKLYIGSAELAAILSISPREARNVLHQFEQQGLTITVSKRLRISLRNFARYLSAQDGSDERETYDTLKAAIKTA